MALLETKVLQVENDQETITNMSNLMGSFGWTVLSVQVTHSQNSKDLGDRVQTTTLNYATMTLQRDKHMPNYAEIVRLENEYHQCADTERGLAKEIRKLEVQQHNSKYTPLLIVFVVFVLYRSVVNAVASAFGAGVADVFVFLCDALFVIVIGYSVLHFILAKYAKNEELRQRVAKLPKTVFGFLNRGRKSNKETRSERLEEAERLHEESIRRMAEVRQQAESLIA